MTSRTRSRSYTTGWVSGQWRTGGFGSWRPYNGPGVANSETVTDQTNNFVNGHWNGGGPFDLTRSTVHFQGIGQVVGNSNFQGSARIHNPVGTNPPALIPPAHPSTAQLKADGVTAIARTEPTNPAFDLSVFLGELRAEGLPNLPGHTVMERTKLAKASGSEYLNIEFGWSPLVRGVRDFCKTVANSDKILGSYQEQANQVIKRNYDWPAEETTQAYATTHGMYPGAGFFTGGGHHERIFKRKWFEASYIYYLPVGSSQNAKNQRFASYARKLLGVDLSPEVLWNLSPWSWAADWFGNVGDVMHNVSAFGTDGLVLRDGYIMCHSGKIEVDSGSFWNLNQVRTITVERKTRHVAAPYGIGFSGASLSTRQIAILGALGLSRT